MEGWANDLSSYANWLYENTKNAWKILSKISNCLTESDYEDLLKELADELLNKEFLAEQSKEEKTGTIYECDGKFKYEEWEEDEEGYY